MQRALSILLIITICVASGCTSARPAQASPPRSQLNVSARFSDTVAMVTLNREQEKCISDIADYLSSKYGQLWFVAVDRNYYSRLTADLYFRSAPSHTRVTRGQVVHMQTLLPIEEFKKMEQQPFVFPKPSAAKPYVCVQAPDGVQWLDVVLTEDSSGDGLFKATPDETFVGIVDVIRYVVPDTTIGTFEKESEGTYIIRTGKSEGGWILHIKWNGTRFEVTDRGSWVS